jgi:hypothetical protein
MSIQGGVGGGLSVVRQVVGRFWEWYQRHYLATLVITTALFLLQAFHLYWLFTDVILQLVTGKSYFIFPRTGMVVYVLVDYLEIPALVSASLLYIFELRRRPNWRSLLYLLLLNTQWLHMLWITDEVVVSTFAQRSLLTWNAAVAWVAILIDYLEVPVMIDAVAKVYQQRHVLWRRLRRRLGGADAAAQPRPRGERARPGASLGSMQQPGTIR